MIARNREHDGEDPQGLAGDLAALARLLDAQRYPGRAWPLSAPRPVRVPVLKRAAWLAAAAAAVCAVLVYQGWAPDRTRRVGRAERAPPQESARKPVGLADQRCASVPVDPPYKDPQPRRRQLPGEASVGRGAADPAAGQVPAEPAAGQAPIPQVVVVEDLDSYSFIDLTAGPPVVSFAMKESWSPLSVVVVLR